MFFVFSDAWDMYNCMIEIETDAGVQRQSIAAPRYAIVTEFTKLVQQIVRHKGRGRVRLSRKYEEFWEPHHTSHMVENEIEFKNNEWLKSEESMDVVKES